MQPHVVGRGGTPARSWTASATTAPSETTMGFPHALDTVSWSSASRCANSPGRAAKAAASPAGEHASVRRRGAPPTAPQPVRGPRAVRAVPAAGPPGRVRPTATAPRAGREVPVPGRLHDEPDPGTGREQPERDEDAGGLAHDAARGEGLLDQGLHRRPRPYGQVAADDGRADVVEDRRNAGLLTAARRGRRPVRRCGRGVGGGVRTNCTVRAMSSGGQHEFPSRRVGDVRALVEEVRRTSPGHRWHARTP